jgi:iron(III) transport system substrate-binding protein
MTTEISNLMARRPFLLALGLIAALMLTVACSSDDNSGPSENSGSSDDAGELVIYSGRSESLVDPLIKKFEEATGIDAKVNYAGTGALAATLLEEGDRSPADVFLLLPCRTT